MRRLRESLSEPAVPAVDRGVGGRGYVGGINSTVLPGVREDERVGEAIGKVLQLWYCGEVWVGLGRGTGELFQGKGDGAQADGRVSSVFLSHILQI